MREEAVVVLRLETGDLPAKSQQAAQSLQKIGTTGETSARQTAAAMRQLPAQLTDVATQLAGGQNPLLILLQQGGQVKDSFGGIGPAIRGIGAAINPVTLGIGALGAAVGLLGLAVYKGAQQDEQLRDSMLLTGNAAGLTASRIQLLADQTAAGTRQSVGSAREIVMALAASGQVSSKVLDSTAKAVALVADVSGEDAKKVAGDFATMSGGVAKWAAEHNKAWNFISVEQYRYIKRLEDQGKAEEAMIFVNQRMTERLSDQQRNLGLLESGWDWLKKAASGAWDAMLGVGRESTTRQQLDIAMARLAALGDNLQPKAKAAAEQRVQILKEQLKLEQQAADARSRNASTNRAAIADEREKEGKKPEFPFSAIRTAEAQYRTDFLRSEKGYYDELDAMRRKDIDKQYERSLIIKGLLDRESREQKDFNSAAQARQDEQLQDLRDAVTRASLEQIEDEKQRGEALVQLDLAIAKRRLKAKGLGAGAADEASRLLEEKAAYDTRALGRETSDNTYTDVKGALSAAFRDSKNPAKAFASALGEAVYTRLTASMADALATAAVGKSGNGGAWGEFLNYLGGLNGGLTVATGGMGTNNTGTSLPTRGGSAMGTNYVPRTMVVKVHEGEAIVPRKYNPAAGGREPGGYGGGGPAVVHNHYNVPPGYSPAAFGAAIEASRRSSEAKLLADAARPGRPMNSAILAGL